MHREGIHKPLIGMLITLAMICANYLIGDNNTHDRYSALLIAVAFCSAALVIARYTEVWYWRAVGVMVALGGTGLVYTLIYGRAGSFWYVSPEVTKAIIRGSLDFGSVVMIACIIQYIYRRHKGERTGFFDFVDPRRHYRDGSS